MTLAPEIGEVALKDRIYLSIFPNHFEDQFRTGLFICIILEIDFRNIKALIKFQNMKTLKFLVIGFLALTLSLQTYGTAQVPDLIIYNGDTLALYSNPLEDFYTNNNPRPKSFVMDGCWSSACWRGYQATWLLENNILYLVKIGSCCFGYKYELNDSILNALQQVIPAEIVSKLREPKTTKLTITYRMSEYNEWEFDKLLKKKLGKSTFRKYKDLIFQYARQTERSADLSQLFKERYENGRVRADWFSGMLRVPKGKRLQYVHMGYMSTYEYELTFEVDKGNVIEAKEFSNIDKVLEIREGYRMMTATSYSMAVPTSLMVANETGYTLTDTVDYQSPDGILSLSCKLQFNTFRMNPMLRRIQVTSTLDSLTKQFSNFLFERQTNDDSRWGTVGWVDGFDKNTNEYIRIFTIVNINGQMLFSLKARLDYDSFYEQAQYITKTVRLMEFGY